MIEPWETVTRVKRAEHCLPDGTRIRFRDFNSLQELAGLHGLVIDHRIYAGGYRYTIDVGPGWGYTGLIKRSDIALEALPDG